MGHSSFRPDLRRDTGTGDESPTPNHPWAHGSLREPNSGAAACANLSANEWPQPLPHVGLDPTVPFSHKVPRQWAGSDGGIEVDRVTRCISSPAPPPAPCSLRLHGFTPPAMRLKTRTVRPRGEGLHGVCTCACRNNRKCLSQKSGVSLLQHPYTVRGRHRSHPRGSKR